MKRILCFLILFTVTSLFTLRLEAPPNIRGIIIEAEPLYIYGVKDTFLRAVMHFESRFDPRAVNRYTKARGVLQILPVMVDDVNRICRIKGLPQCYTWRDAFDPYKSIEMWHIKQGHTNPEYFQDKACRIWFGTGVQYDGMRWEDYFNIVTQGL